MNNCLFCLYYWCKQNQRKKTKNQTKKHDKRDTKYCGTKKLCKRNISKISMRTMKKVQQTRQKREALEAKHKSDTFSFFFFFCSFGAVGCCFSFGCWKPFVTVNKHVVKVFVLNKTIFSFDLLSVGDARNHVQFEKNYYSWYQSH